MSKPRVALLGLGIMGTGMAGRLLSANFPLTVYNRNSAKAHALAGAIVAKSPREATVDADIVISIVADDVASREVWLGENGALKSVRPGTHLVESSTLTVKWILELLEAAARQNCQLLDAPVTGSKPQAAAGELLFLVGGSAETLAAVRPVLAVLGRDAVHLGASGSGARLKLINNFLCGVQAASFAEAVAMISAGGLDANKSLAVLTGGAPGSPLVKTISARAAANDPDPNFVLRLMAKDLGYALDEAKRSGVTSETAAAALAVFKHAIAKGHGEEDISAVVKSFRRN
jgi:3-hydroxyisobutyrate dehydrogenase